MMLNISRRQSTGTHSGRNGHTGEQAYDAVAISNQEKKRQKENP